MQAVPDTYAIDLPTLHSELAMPYTLTPGKAAGVFLAEMANRRIVGSRFVSGLVIAPAQDFSPVDGESEFELVEVPATGELCGFTEVAGDIIGLVRLDGCDNEFPHKMVECSLNALKIGTRVSAVWADGTEQSILAIAGFKPDAGAAVGSVASLADPSAAVEVVPYKLRLQYEHSYGPYYGRLFDEIRVNRRVIGVRTSDGDLALLPPREVDDITHRRTGTWKALPDTGTIRACSIINLEFVGQTRPPPYVYAEIVLDGASTKMIHMIDIDDVESAKQRIKPGTRVRAVWREGEREGSLRDIERFEVIDE
ncbi:OB-fold domain-containing protein [Sphingomonas sp.]|uniref:OB-fold nucleic acid binding domain-containing protein n=1 Tax=Sphingomonas sp. TaxID=28214 RepID=UPI0025D8BB86|nr:OB-fold domain-containing protein [Sphingomonas sp.]